ncbi:MAG: YbaB/EbfC family nucleoid-associated protein, partial [Phycicoccus sp.]
MRAVDLPRHPVMPDPDEGLDEVLGRIEQQRRSVDQAVTAAGRRSVTGRSADQLVSVTVDGKGTVRGIDIRPGALDEHDQRSLAAAIVPAWQTASADAARQLADSCPEVFGALAPPEELLP